jgi:hypothetical protein
LEGGDFGFGGGGSSVTANGSRGTQSEACEDTDDGDDGEEFDQGEGRRRAARGSRFLILDFEFWIVKRRKSRDVINLAGISGSRSCGMSCIFVLVKKGESGCSHSHDHNFRSQISKGKKQFLHLGGIAGSNIDYRVAGGIGLASDQWGNSGGKKGGGGGDGGID